jgi:hypothetical protein
MVCAPPWAGLSIAPHQAPSWYHSFDSGFSAVIAPPDDSAPNPANE